MGKHSAKRTGLFGGQGGKGHGAARRTPGSVERRESMASQRARGRGPALSDPSARKRGALETAPPRLKAEKDRRKRRSRRVLYSVLGGIALLLVIGVVGAYAYLKNIESTMQGTVVKQKELEAVLDKAKPQEPFTILLLGADYRPGEEKYRTDVMILTKVDPQQKKIWMVSIPRDTRVEIPGHGVTKINSAHFIGGKEGPAYAVRAVEDLTGQSINHYMEVNFRGFKKVVDALGGVWVDVPVEIDDIKADYSPGHRAKHIDAGYQLLDGEHALTFVRSRKFPEGDFKRIEHQQIFFKALAEQMASMDNVAKLPGTVSAAAQYVTTDMSLIELIKTARALQGAGSKNLYTASLKGEWKTPFVYLDEEHKADVLAKFEAGRSFEDTAPIETPTEQPASGSSAGSATSGSTAIEPADISITVRNGAGIAGCAKQASSIFKARGFEVTEVGNANQFVYDKTLVVYKDQEAAASLVAQALPPGAKLVASRGMYSFDSDILVVIGKDWDVSKVPVSPIETN